MAMTAQSKVARITARLALSGLVLLGFSLIADRLLALVGFPSEISYTYPPGFSRTERNYEYEHEFTTNTRGLRNRELPVERPEGIRRVFVVGDSFTEGLGVADDESFSALLDREYSEEGVQFINGGIRGRGPLHYGRVFLSVGQEFDPHALLICMHTNDVTDTRVAYQPQHLYREHRPGLKGIVYALWPRFYVQLRGIKNTALTRGIENPEDFVAMVSGRAAAAGIPEERIDQWEASLPPELLEAANEGLFSGAILASGLVNPGYLSDSLDIATPEAEAKWGAMVEILDELVRTCRVMDVRVAMVYTCGACHYDPEYGEVWRRTGSIYRSEWSRETTELQRRLEQWAERSDVPYLDLTGGFRAAREEDRPLNYALDGHWNAAGHELAARLISDWLRADDPLGLAEN